MLSQVGYQLIHSTPWSKQSCRMCDKKIIFARHGKCDGETNEITNEMYIYISFQAFSTDKLRLYLGSICSLDWDEGVAEDDNSVF